MLCMAFNTHRVIRDISRHHSTCVQTAKAWAKPELCWGGGGGGSGGMLPREIFEKSDAIICIFVHFEGHKIAP